jgi:formamidopyrimidine-DNA glycosylase
VPELPEVERVRRELRPAMEGARFERVIVRRRDLRSRLPRDFSPRLEGTQVRCLRRRAKYLLADLSSGDTLVMHLGMSGWFSISKGAVELSAHDHVVFEMSSGSTVVFNDPRRFGSMRIVDAASADRDPALASLGPEPLDRRFDASALAAALHGRRTTLKAALSDQRVVAGLGNIYVSEALHRAGLSPRRRASTLVTRSGSPKPALGRLVNGIRATLRDALSSREGDRFRVYDREGCRCVRRGCAGSIRRVVQGGRSTFFCAECQR